jgi:hypothetical protein
MLHRARSAARDGLASCHLPLQGTAGWNGRVDRKLRRELLTRREEDQRVRQLVSPPRDSTWSGFPRRPRWSGSASTKKTRGGLVSSWPGGVGRAGRWSARRERGQRGCWPSTRTTTRTCSGHSWTPCAVRSPRVRLPRQTRPIWRTGCGSVPAASALWHPVHRRRRTAGAQVAQNGRERLGQRDVHEILPVGVTDGHSLNDASYAAMRYVGMTTTEHLPEVRLRGARVPALSARHSVADARIPPGISAQAPTCRPKRHRLFTSITQGDPGLGCCRG